MKKQKRILALVLAMIMLCFATACGKAGTSDAAAPQTSAPAESAAPTEASAEVPAEATHPVLDAKWDRYEKFDITPDREYTFVYANWSAHCKVPQCDRRPQLFPNTPVNRFHQQSAFLSNVQQIQVFPE